MTQNSLPAEAENNDLIPATPPASPKKRRSKRQGSTLALYARRFWRNKTAVVGLVIFVGIVLFAILGEMFSPHSYLDTDFTSLSTPPGEGDHIWGTNNAGNDLFAQTAHGTQRSLIIALIVSFGTTALAAFVGASAAYFRGLYEKLSLGLIHFLMVIPTFLILALVSNSAGGHWAVISLAMVFTSWFFPARVVWAIALSIREREFVAAARYMGVPGVKIVLRHIIPNIGSLLIIQFTLGVVSAVIAETGLSFIGFGIKIPDVSLGSLIGTGSSTISSAPWEFYFPAAALTLLTCSMAFVADGMRDALDPNSQSGGAA